MDSKEKFFDNVNDNFHKICTANGIDENALSEFIINIIQLMPKENHSVFAENLILEIIIWCSYNGYEALGILEAAKYHYNAILENTDFGDDNKDDDEN
jgi:hypothetical protein